MMSLSFLFGRNEPDGLFGLSRRCVLTALTSSGRPYPCKVRVAACSDDQQRLWFVVPRTSGVLPHLLRDSSVVMSTINPDSQKLVHVSGEATLMQGRHEPVYLAPGFQQPTAFEVRTGDLDVMLIKVELSGEVSEEENVSEPIALDEEAPMLQSLTSRLGALAPTRWLS